MTIKVVARGIPPEDIVYRVSCRECQSILQFNRGDTESGTERNQKWYMIVCPVCHFQIFMEELKEDLTLKGKRSYE